MASGLTERSHSMVYVWKPDWQVVPGHAVELPRPVVSLHGPPGLVPQCRVAHVLFRPWTFSMTSSSPTLGQFW